MCEMSETLKNFRPESLCLLKESNENYWRYSRQTSEDFILAYAEKPHIYDEKSAKRKFREGSDVLVRWTDGLFYLGNIIKVEDEYSRCAVKFEDGSQYWALYKDIHKGPTPGGEIVCTVCESGVSQPPDEIVICDKCTLGYHQQCHIPKIESSVLKPEILWGCRKCVFASTAKKGGAIKKGQNAQALQIMKQTLPYDLESLTWDIPHRSNLQQTYCYCGGPGEWYMKMIQCSRCKQWFHEACLQCIEEPMLFGDRFYIFVCSVCNKGPEFLRRLALRWPDITHLVLFNLTVQHGRKYFDLDTTIMTFVTENWSLFQVKNELANTSVEQRKQKILEILQNNKSRFKSGKEVKKKTTLWGLRARVPPPIPVIVLPESGPITDDVLNTFKATGRKSKFLIKADSTPVPLKRNRKKEQLHNNISATSLQHQKRAIDGHSEEKYKKVRLSKSAENMDCVMNNGVRKFSQCSSASISEISDSEDTSSSQGTLNSIIPHPNNFEGLNHPFRNGDRTRNCKSHSSTLSNQTQNSKASLPKKTKQRCRKRISVNGRTHSLLNRLIGSCVLDTGSESEILIHKNFETAVTSTNVNFNDLNTSVNSYFGAADRIANGEKFNVLAKRIAPDGKVQYLIEWEGVSS